MKYALITGGLGFIGSYIARRLLSLGVVDRVVLLDHFGRYTSSLEEDFHDYRRFRIRGIEDRIDIERGEAKYGSVLTRLIGKYAPEYIFHLAALPLAKLDNMNCEEAVEGAIVSTTNIFQAVSFLREHSGYEPRRIVYTSSSMVYGDFERIPADEDHPTRPKEIYGTVKLAGENMVRGLARFYQLPATIIRPSAVYGPTDMNQRVTQIFLEHAIQGRKIVIQGRDEALDFTFVEDTAKGFVLAATHENGVGETFNVTHGEAHLLLDYVLELKKYFPNLEYEIVERDGSRPRRGTLSIEKARRLLGYAPDHDLAEGVRKYVEFVRGNDLVWKAHAGA